MFYVMLDCLQRHGKNDFAKVSKNLTRYRSENNLVRLSK